MKSRISNEKVEEDSLPLWICPIGAQMGKQMLPEFWAEPKDMEPYLKLKVVILPDNIHDP